MMTPQWPVSRQDLERIVGAKVRNTDVYQSAFVHKSALKELSCQWPCVDTYERLEFMGDAVINMVVARYLCDRYPEHREGWLTRIRTKLVSGKCLCVFARKLNLQAHIIMNHKALSQGWNMNPRMLEDCFEALVGAIYFDLGMLAAKLFILGMIERHADFTEVEADTNHKDRLMRFTQSQGMPLPVYQASGGLPTSCVFEVHAVVSGRPCGHGVHRNKKEAEQLAAEQALMTLGVSPTF